MPIPSNKSIEKLLNFSALQQKVIAQNIANAETKNYKRKEVEFI
jgi:flagellar basal-body rod protein FlgB